MSTYLLIGGDKDGELVQWPRHDQRPCVFAIAPEVSPVYSGYSGGVRTTAPYFPHEIFSGTPQQPRYRVATPESWLHPDVVARIAFQLLARPLEDLAKIRTAPDEPW